MKSKLLLVFFALPCLAWGQDTVTLDQCYERAEANYPLIQNRGLLEKTKKFSVDNAAKGYLPQINIGGHATYQSEVTQIPVELPGVEPLSRNQYRIYGEVSQAIYHGGTVGLRKMVEESEAVVEEKELEVELYQIRSRVNELYFGILLLQEQIAQAGLGRNDILSALRKTEALIANGAAIPSSADVLRAELLRVDQQVLDMESIAESYRKTLGLFINESIDEKTVLEKPTYDEGIALEVVRPELRLLDAQQRILSGRKSLSIAARRPRLDLFILAGYGRAGLNMLENRFSFYYMGGIRFSWHLSGYYTIGREKQIFDLRQQMVDVRREAFLFNTRLSQDQHYAEIRRLEKLVAIDDEIITLRKKVKETAGVQLEEGVITSTDFVREVNAEDQARQARVLHETQWLLARAKLEFATGQ
jgi:outer membrane protein TolC